MFGKFWKRWTGRRLAVFVDGPNILRSEFNVNLNRLRSQLEDIGRIKIGEVFLNQYATDKLIEAVISQGFEARLGLGGEKEKDSDVDVYMAVNAVRAVYNSSIDTLVLVTRDADFLPVIQLAKQEGLDTVVVGRDPGFSTALQNAADRTVFLEE